MVTEVNDLIAPTVRRRFSLDQVARVSRSRRSGEQVIRCPACGAECEAIVNTDGVHDVTVIVCLECGCGVVMTETPAVP